MEDFMHCEFKTDNTNISVVHLITEHEDEKKAKIDWHSKSANIYFECGYRKFALYKNWNEKIGEKEAGFITAIIRFLDEKGNTIYTNVLSTRDYTNEPTLKYLSRTGSKNKRIQRDSDEFYATIKRIGKLLYNSEMDSTTSAILTYLLNKMQENTSEICKCPEFLYNLILKGHAIKSKSGKHSEQKFDNEEIISK